MRKRRRRGTRVIRSPAFGTNECRLTGKTSDGEHGNVCASKQCRKYKNNIVVAPENVAARIGLPCEFASSLLGAKGGAKRQRRDERDRPAVGAPRVGQGPDVEATAEQAVRPLPARLSAKTAVRFSRSLALVPSEERSVDISSVGGHEERVSLRLSRASRVPSRESHRASRERRLSAPASRLVSTCSSLPRQADVASSRHPLLSLGPSC